MKARQAAACFYQLGGHPEPNYATYQRDQRQREPEACLHEGRSASAHAYSFVAAHASHLGCLDWR
jgi:hypothetical protein